LKEFSIGRVAHAQVVRSIELMKGKWSVFYKRKALLAKANFIELAKA